MPVTIVIGTQWGDEGKGRVVDYFAAQADLVARYNGGDNAGHTIIAEGHVLALHHIPSGILYPQALCLIGAGALINPLNLIKEMDTLNAVDIDVSAARLKISAAAHLILPTHLELDGASESKRSTQALGTTRCGIGPAYADKARRIGLRAGQMRTPEAFAVAARDLLEHHNTWLTRIYQQEPIPLLPTIEQLRLAAQRLLPHIVDATALLGNYLAAGKSILCEGAQGTLLDIDKGTYPYVTSSHPTSGGALTGLGFGPKAVERVVGVAKAYTTRVGAGPFPTELDDEMGETLRRVGHEYGTTTGRPRRCGWLDAVILRYAAQVNGLTEFAVTKLDVLSGLPELQVAVAYEFAGERLETFPAEWGSIALTTCRPVYETLPGWKEDISGVRRREDLPANARAYLDRIEALTGVPITFIGVGAEREAMILP